MEWRTMSALRHGLRIDVASVDAMAMGAVGAGVHRRGRAALRGRHAADGYATHADPRSLACAFVLRGLAVAAPDADVAAGHGRGRSVFGAHAAAHAAVAGGPAAAGLRTARHYLAVGLRRGRPGCDRAGVEAHEARCGVRFPDAARVRMGVAERGAFLLAPSGAVRRGGAARVAARS